MRIGIFLIIVLMPWTAFAEDSKEREHADFLKLSGGGVGDLARPGIRIKTYRRCAQADSCSPQKWVGFFGTNLLPELSTDSDAIRQGRRFQTASIVKTVFYAAVPISLFSGTMDAMKGNESIVIGATLFSLVGAVAAHIVENKQFYMIEKIYNGDRIKVGIDPGYRFDQVGVTCQVRI